MAEEPTGRRAADDRDEITTLLFAYAERIDAGDFAGLADLMAGAELTFEGYDTVVRGRQAVQSLYERGTLRHGDGTPLTKHVTTNVIVEVAPTGCTAAARSYFTVLQAVPGELALQPVIAGRYRDRFERAEGRWRFSGRHMLVDLAGDLSHHLRIDLDG
ncbi:MAG: nuclear transport factor 2 family protein [Acidimicrobiales bacterium]